MWQNRGMRDLGNSLNMDFNIRNNRILVLVNLWEAQSRLVQYRGYKPIYLSKVVFEMKQEKTA